MLRIIRMVLFTGLSLYSFIGIFLVLKFLVNFKRYDELEKRVVIDSFAMSMIIIMIVNLTQLILVLIMPIGFQSLISSDSLVTGSGSHIDSFFFDCSVFGLTYMIRRYHFGLMKKRYILLIIIYIFLIVSMTTIYNY
ncbi:hypothetical protein ACTXNW_05050 [Enterococcus malodoratus]|uniref:hypothetical protein n=1 Tax=Enterococcus malodoratus TaxID=71451 RepID=UPI003FD23982